MYQSVYSSAMRPLAAGKRPTYLDIAHLAGTSKATVSLVLNNRDGALRISQRTRDEVLAAARKLGYVPDLGARQLRHRDGAAAAPEITIAILRPAGTPLGIVSFVIAAASAALTRVVATHQIVLEEYHPGALAAYTSLVATSRFHGAIITSPTPVDEAFLEATEVAVPLVVFQRDLVQHATVNVDNVLGGRLAVQHLVARGRRRIAALSTPLPSSAQAARVEGYRRGLEEAGLLESAYAAVVPVFDEAASAAAAAELLAARTPDAVFACSDVIALGVLHAAAQAGLRVPQDVAVVGYDDFAFAPFLVPPLTTVRLPYGAMVEAAIGWLVPAIRGQADGILHQTWRPELVVRASS